jgi:hypothetical protein
MANEFDKWIEFLKPENLKGNLISCSLYIATYESFKDYVIDEVKFFFNTGFTGDEFIFSPRYKTSVLDKNKSVLAASLLWLKEQEAISEADIDSFEDLRKYRNKLAHKMIDLLFEGSFDDFPQNLAALINLRVKIEKWWVLNIEIPTNPDFHATDDVSENDIQTSSEILYKIILDILSGDEEASNYYYKEFLKHKEKTKRDTL